MAAIRLTRMALEPDGYTPYLIYSRLTAYGKLCKDFRSERRYTGRKFLLPKKLSKRTMIKIDMHGEYEIHYNIQQGAILVTQKDTA